MNDSTCLMMSTMSGRLALKRHGEGSESALMVINMETKARLSLHLSLRSHYVVTGETTRTPDASSLTSLIRSDQR